MNRYHILWMMKVDFRVCMQSRGHESLKSW